MNDLTDYEYSDVNTYLYGKVIMMQFVMMCL